MKKEWKLGMSLTNFE